MPYAFKFAVYLLACCLAFMALSACSLREKASFDEIVCGPPPTAEQADAAVQKWMQRRDLPDQQSENIRVGDCLHFFGRAGYTYAWEILFEHYYMAGIGPARGYVGPRQPQRTYFNVTQIDI
jgi:hypothetical protein